MAQGQTVTQGTPLGQIGLSGNTEFPHLHLSVRRNGADIDPFAPETSACGETGEDLWRDPMPYLAGGIVGIGLSPAVPDFATIKAGTTTSATTASPALVIWAHLFGQRQGDKLALSITGPTGEVISDTVTIERTQAAWRAEDTAPPHA